MFQLLNTKITVRLKIKNIFCNKTSLETEYFRSKTQRLFNVI